MGPIGCPETSVATDQRRINIAEEQKPHLHSGGKLKSRVGMLVRTLSYVLHGHGDKVAGM